MRIALIVGVTLCCFASAGADVKSILTAKYEAVTAALQHKDLKAVGIMLTADYKAYGPSGDSHDRAQVLQDFDRQARSLTGITWKRTLSHLVVKGNTATVTVLGHFTGTTLGSQRHKLELNATTLDAWTKIGGAWKLASSHLQQSKMMLDGKQWSPAGPRHP